MSNPGTTFKNELSIYYQNVQGLMLAVEIVLENKTKIIISTCYRVGTLGLNNAEEILKGIGTLIRKKSVKKCILVGEINIPNINWLSGTLT